MADIRISAQLENLKQVSATFTITMPLEDWKRLEDMLPTQYPAWKLGDAISKLMAKARAQFSETIKEPADG